MDDQLLIAKRCTRCREEKPREQFHCRSASKDGLQPICSDCQRVKAQTYYRNNKARLAAQNAAYIKAHPEVRRKALQNYAARHAEAERKRFSEYRRANPEKRAALGRAWRQTNAALVNTYSARYRALRLDRMRLCDADLLELVELEAFDLARRREAATGIKWEVDHAIPLQSPIVCGLHNERNLQVIPRSENRAKSNRHWSDMP